jgi:hypothetical protein
MTRNLKALGLALVAVFAMSAIAASAAQATVGSISYDKTATKVTATQDATAPNQVFTLTGGAVSVTCNEYHATALLDGTGNQTTIETKEMAYTHNGTNECASNISGFTPKVEMNECQYKFHAGNTIGELSNMEIEATADVVNCNATNPYVVVNGGGVCTARVFGNTLNQGLTGIKIRTITGGAKEDLTLEANVTGLHATHTGGCAFFGDKTTTEGTYTGKVTITAEDNSAVQKDITVT